MSLTHVDPHVSEIVMVWIQCGDLLMVWIQISHFLNSNHYDLVVKFQFISRHLSISRNMHALVYF
jgi:hypothetical protein